eukprot:TRINITY_DN5033_c0_g1::TRINITY_DN5033_c0_g1_i1::g.24855::m.24855 TRINITY_DN5033_c0_g1::TRINITY_DN5033_c0_g1_i1::g.24855  ORF type:complete len:394 (+),score=57.99 TRINITY_DN5033_c0_g1_i1:36-1184(+)
METKEGWGTDLRINSHVEVDSFGVEPSSGAQNSLFSSTEGDSLITIRSEAGYKSVISLEKAEGSFLIQNSEAGLFEVITRGSPLLSLSYDDLLFQTATNVQVGPRGSDSAILSSRPGSDLLVQPAQGRDLVLGQPVLDVLDFGGKIVLNAPVFPATNSTIQLQPSESSAFVLSASDDATRGVASFESMGAMFPTELGDAYLFQASSDSSSSSDLSLAYVPQRDHWDTDSDSSPSTAPQPLITISKNDTISMTRPLHLTQIEGAESGNVAISTSCTSSTCPVQLVAGGSSDIVLTPGSSGYVQVKGPIAAGGSSELNMATQVYAPNSMRLTVMETYCDAGLPSCSPRLNCGSSSRGLLRLVSDSAAEYHLFTCGKQGWVELTN